MLVLLSVLLACGDHDDEVAALETQVADLEARLAALEGRLEGAIEGQPDTTALQAQADDNSARLDVVEFTAEVSEARLDQLDEDLAGAAELLAVVTVDDRDVVLSGVNLHLHSGTGRTDSVNGLGNLIIGYAVDDKGNDVRTGSHTLVIGDEHDWTGYAGIVAGWGNRLGAPYASVLGGLDNEATGTRAVVVGGIGNQASGEESVVLGGNSNDASGELAVVAGGALNVASGEESAIAGGNANQASGTWAAVAGGRTNHAEGGASVVVGGQANRATGIDSVAVGGSGNDVAGDRSVLLGGVAETVDDSDVVGP